MSRFLPQPLSTTLNLRGPRGSKLVARSPSGGIVEVDAPHGSAWLELTEPGVWAYTFPGAASGTITVLPTTAPANTDVKLGPGGRRGTH